MSFLVEGTEQQADYVRRSTVFLFAEYLGWVEIFRRDLQFLDLGDSESNQQIMFLLTKINGTLNAAHTSDAECFRIFRADQRALGELMIEPDSNPESADASAMPRSVPCSRLENSPTGHKNSSTMSNSRLANPTGPETA